MNSLRTTLAVIFTTAALLPLTSPQAWADSKATFDDKALAKSLAGTWQENLASGMSAEQIAKINLSRAAGGIVRFNADHTFSFLSSCTKQLPPGVKSIDGTWKFLSPAKLETTVMRDNVPHILVADIKFGNNQMILGVNGKGNPYGKYLGPVPPVCQ